MGQISGLGAGDYKSSKLQMRLHISAHVCYVCIFYILLLSFIQIKIIFKAQWENWEGWNECTKSCGRGEQVNTRECEKFGECHGNSTIVRGCNINPCRKNIERIVETYYGSRLLQDTLLLANI